MKILLVDDEKKFASMLAKRLELRGIEVDYFFDANSAIQRVENGNSYDIAVLDVKMPGMGGIELRRKLCRMAPQMKFIFLTGHGSSIDYKTGVNEASFYLPKPLKINDLIETLYVVAPEVPQK
ncbi:MAG: response regulator [Candidatus Magnetomorum sp.]|nr:response regulator [Candidatus Magnetomorum sp.]